MLFVMRAVGALVVCSLEIDAKRALHCRPAMRLKFRAKEWGGGGFVVGFFHWVGLVVTGWSLKVGSYNFWEGSDRVFI